MTGDDDLMRASQEAICVAVDDGDGRIVMLALLSGKQVDALLALAPVDARALAETLLSAADAAETGGALPAMPVTRMGSA